MQKTTGRRLRRREAAQFLTEHGYPIAATTLAKLACIGGGPAFESFGKIPLYEPADLIDWGRTRSSGRRTSTSDSGIIAATVVP